MKMNKINIPGLSADQQAKLQQMMANRKPITTQTVVTKIVEQKISADQFKVPAGYTKRELPKPGEHGMMSAPQGCSGVRAVSALGLGDSRMRRRDRESKKRAGSIRAPLVVSIKAGEVTSRRGARPIWPRMPAR